MVMGVLIQRIKRVVKYKKWFTFKEKREIVEYGPFEMINESNWT